MLDAHVHCANCGCAIPTQIKVAGGKTKAARITAVTEAVLKPSPDGSIVAIQRQVPVCVDCHEAIAKAHKETAAPASRLIVPSLARAQ